MSDPTQTTDQVAAEYDPFKGETGLKDDYDGVVEDAWFATQDNYGDVVMLHLKVRVDDPARTDNGEEVETRYPCGPEWATYDGGETVEHPKGAKKGFNNNTRYMKMIVAAMQIPELEAELRRRSRDSGGMGPKRADIWKGIKCHWKIETEHLKFKDRETQEMIERDVNTVVPTAFLGVGGETGTSVPSGTSPAASPAATSAASPAATPDGIPPAIAMTLRGLAKNAANHGEFADAAMEVDGVLSDPTIMQKIADEGYFASLKAG